MKDDKEVQLTVSACYHYFGLDSDISGKYKVPIVSKSLEWRWHAGDGATSLSWLWPKLFNIGGKLDSHKVTILLKYERCQLTVSRYIWTVSRVSTTAPYRYYVWKFWLKCQRHLWRVTFTQVILTLWALYIFHWYQSSGQNNDNRLTLSAAPPYHPSCSKCNRHFIKTIEFSKDFKEFRSTNIRLWHTKMMRRWRWQSADSQWPFIKVVKVYVDCQQTVSATSLSWLRSEPLNVGKLDSNKVSTVLEYSWLANRLTVGTYWLSAECLQQLIIIIVSEKLIFLCIMLRCLSNDLGYEIDKEVLLTVCWHSLNSSRNIDCQRNLLIIFHVTWRLLVDV